MDELMDILANDDSAAQASDKIKDILFAKSAEKIDDIRPNVAASLFDQDVDLDDGEETVVAEIYGLLCSLQEKPHGLHRDFLVVILIAQVGPGVFAFNIASVIPINQDQVFKLERFDLLPQRHLVSP